MNSTGTSTGISYWIQRADYSSDEFDAVQVEEAILAYQQHDWNAELAVWGKMTDKGEDCCLPRGGESPCAPAPRPRPVGLACGWLACAVSPLGSDNPDSAFFRNTKSLVRDTSLRVRCITPGVPSLDAPGTVVRGCWSSVENPLLPVTTG